MLAGWDVSECILLYTRLSGVDHSIEEHSNEIDVIAQYENNEYRQRIRQSIRCDALSAVWRSSSCEDAIKGRSNMAMIRRLLALLVGWPNSTVTRGFQLGGLNCCVVRT